MCKDDTGIIAHFSFFFISINIYILFCHSLIYLFTNGQSFVSSFFYDLNVLWLPFSSASERPSFLCRREKRGIRGRMQVLEVWKANQIFWVVNTSVVEGVFKAEVKQTSCTGRLYMKIITQKFYIFTASENDSNQTSSFLFIILQSMSLDLLQNLHHDVDIYASFFLNLLTWVELRLEWKWDLAETRWMVWGILVPILVKKVFKLGAGQPEFYSRSKAKKIKSKNEGNQN